MRRLGFSSDAGYRFERGVDFELPPTAVERSTQLIIAICGGRAGPLSDVHGVLPSREGLRVRAARVRRLLGVDLPVAAIAGVFTRLNFAFARDGEDFIVTPPSYRFDLVIEEDLRYPQRRRSTCRRCCRPPKGVCRCTTSRPGSRRATGRRS
jgi:phenylalanyl-tRNA synthetase beta chain